MKAKGPINAKKKYVRTVTPRESRSSLHSFRQPAARSASKDSMAWAWVKNST